MKGQQTDNRYKYAFCGFAEIFNLVSVGGMSLWGVISVISFDKQRLIHSRLNQGNFVFPRHTNSEKQMFVFWAHGLFGQLSTETH